jgi:hypothetical protein
MFYKLYSEKKEKKRIYLPTYPYNVPKSVGRVWANWNIFNGGLAVFSIAGYSRLRRPAIILFRPAFIFQSWLEN